MTACRFAPALDLADQPAETMVTAVVQSPICPRGPQSPMTDARLSWATGPVHSNAYLYGDELEIHIAALNDFCSTASIDPWELADWARPVDFSTAPPPSSPSSVAFLPSCYPPSPLKPTVVRHKVVVVPEMLRVTKDVVANVFIKAEPKPIDVVQIHHRPPPLPPTTTTSRCTPPDDDDREFLRLRQRGYERRYRSRKRSQLKKQRDVWLRLEMKLAGDRSKRCQPVVRVKRRRENLLTKVCYLLQEERLLRGDRIAMQSLCAWEQISRIREYTDKNELRTTSEWQHNADKILGQCAALGPLQFNPYAPTKLRFTW